jgi:sulfite dehydrogenase
MSNLVLGGFKQISDVSFGYDGLKAIGVRVVQGEVTAIDASTRKVRLAGGGELGYDRLVLSPGVDFMLDQIGGLQRRSKRTSPTLEGRKDGKRR